MEFLIKQYTIGTSSNPCVVLLSSSILYKHIINGDHVRAIQILFMRNNPILASH